MNEKPLTFGELLATFRTRPQRHRMATYISVPSVVFLLAVTLGLVSARGGAAGFPSGKTADQILPGSSMTAVEIFLNNARVMVAILIGGVLTLSLGMFLVSLLNGIHIGAGIGFLADSYGPATAVAAVAPHGLIEVAAYVVAGSVSVRISLLVLARRTEMPGRTPRTRDVLTGSVTMTLLALGLLAAAAVVEATVTPSIVGWL